MAREWDISAVHQWEARQLRGLPGLPANRTLGVTLVRWSSRQKTATNVHIGRDRRMSLSACLSWIRQGESVFNMKLWKMAGKSLETTRFGQLSLMGEPSS